MRRPFILKTCALLVALAPAVSYAQTQPPAQAPAQQGTTQQAPPAAQPTGPKLAVAAPSGMLLIQIKPAETAAFEELIKRIQAGVAKSTDEALKKQMATFKIFRATENMGANALYVATIDPAVKDTEYELFAILQKVLTPDELRDAAVIEMSKKAASAFAGGYNLLNLTPVGGGM